MTGQHKYRDHRHPASAEAMLTIGSRTDRVAIADVSSQGLRVRIDRPLVVGTHASIQINGFKRRATIRWVRNGWAGLRLAEALSTKDMASLRQMRSGLGRIQGAGHHGFREL